MVLDIEKAVKEYLEDNMITVVGHGNATIEIHRRRFPDDSQAEGVVVYAELREGNGDTNGDVESVAIRVHIRTHNEESSFTLFQNVDKLLDNMVEKNLDDDTQLCLCHRNSGPNPYMGPGDGMHYETALYEATVRRIL